MRVDIPAFFAASFDLASILLRIVFVIAFVASVWSFCHTLSKRFGVPGKTRAFDFPFDHSGRRSWRLFREVLLQSRVMRERPVAGFLHALVMWGFLAFVFASLEHLSWGIRGLQRAEGPSGWYATFVAWWACAVLIGILGLAFRRFVLRPKPLGELSPTSGLVATLIALLMVTYILGWRVLTAGGLAWKANWWAHTLSFFALLVVIPRSKHLHLVLGPFGVFFRSEQTSTLRSLRNDDDFGMIRFDDLSWKDVLQVNTCVECGRCTDACPANSVGRLLSPKEVILGMQRGLRSGGDVIAGSEADVKAGKAWIREPDLCECFTCGACEQACATGIEHLGTKILDVRRGLVSEGRITNEKIVNLFASMERQPRNPWGMSRSTREKFIQAERFPLFDGSQEYLFWLGCCLSFDDHGHKVARAMRRVLDAAGLSWGVLEEEPCCGEAARRLGNEYLFLEMSEELIEKLREKRVKKMLVCCPHCAAMLDRDYRQIAAYRDLGIEVVHHSEFLAGVIGRLPLDPLSEQIAYHDPCYLARARGVVEQPREVIATCGGAIVEMEHHKSRTFCCGGGGAQIFIEDDRHKASGERVNNRRFSEVLATRASTLAVACPYCPIMLRDAANHANCESVEILDIAEFVAKRLRNEVNEPCTPKSCVRTA